MSSPTSDTAPATPGSYGLVPSGFRLPASTRLGPVRLRVAELSRSLDFYQQVLGLELLDRAVERALLGAASPSGTALVELHQRSGVRPAPGRGRMGLFHFAILLPDRPALASFARHLGESGVRAGSADHLVSEALYLQDPDNLGIEVYRDRRQSEWRRFGRELMMTTEPIEMEGLLEAAGEKRWQGIPHSAVMGHVHLHVGDLEAASAFYSEALGFDRTVWDYPGALFFGAGGYHHHLGTNLWAGRNAARPSVDEAQLLEWTLELPDAANVSAVAASLERAGLGQVEIVDSATSLTVADPWGTRVRIVRGASS